jgi:hypothetical protein
VTETDPALLVTDDHERSEAETTPALHHLGHTVDVDELVGEFTVALFPFAALAWFTCHDLVPTCFRLLRSEDGRQKNRCLPSSSSVVRRPLSVVRN